MRTVLSIAFPRDERAPRRARAALQKIPASFLPRLDDLQLMVSELVSNGLIHGGLEASDRLELVVLDDEQHLRVEVHDPGARYDAALAGWERALHGNGEREVSGYGFLLVRSLASRSGVSEQDGTVAWFEIDHNGR